MRHIPKLHTGTNTLNSLFNSKIITINVLLVSYLKLIYPRSYELFILNPKHQSYVLTICTFYCKSNIIFVINIKI